LKCFNFDLLTKLKEQKLTMSTIINLNVGGKVFSIEEEVLKSIPYFKKMLEGEWVEKNAKEIRIKRSSINFNYIIDVVQGFSDYIPTFCKDDLDFYGIDYNKDDFKELNEEYEYDHKINDKCLIVEKLNSNCYTNQFSYKTFSNTFSSLIPMYERYDFKNIVNSFVTPKYFGLFNNKDEILSFSPVDDHMLYFENKFSDFNGSNEIRISRLADCIEEFNLVVTLPALPPGTYWKNNVGFKLLKEFVFSVILPKSEYRDENYSWFDFTINQDKVETVDLLRKDSIFMEIESDLFFKKVNSTFNLSEVERKCISQKEVTLFIPLNILFESGDNRLKVPFNLIAAQFCEFKINLAFEELNKLIEGNPIENPNKFTIDNSLLNVNYLHLEQDLRALIAQRKTIFPFNFVQSERFESNGELNQTFTVNFNYFIKDILIVIRNEEDEFEDSLENFGIIYNNYSNIVKNISVNLLKFYYSNKMCPNGVYYYSYSNNARSEFTTRSVPLQHTGFFNIKCEFKDTRKYKINVYSNTYSEQIYSNGYLTLNKDFKEKSQDIS